MVYRLRLGRLLQGVGLFSRETVQKSCNNSDVKRYNKLITNDIWRFHNIRVSSLGDFFARSREPLGNASLFSFVSVSYECGWGLM